MSLIVLNGYNYWKFWLDFNDIKIVEQLEWADFRKDVIHCRNE